MLNKKFFISAFVCSLCALQVSAQVVNKNNDTPGNRTMVGARSKVENPDAIVTKDRDTKVEKPQANGHISGQANRTPVAPATKANGPAVMTAPGDPNAKAKKEAPKN